MRDTWRIFDCRFLHTPIYLSLPRNFNHLDRACMWVYICVYIELAVVSIREKGKRRPPSLYFEFLTRGNTTSRRNSIPGRVVTPVADIFPRDRFACIWLSARFCRENRATNENSCLLMLVHRPPPRFKRKRQIRSSNIRADFSANSYPGYLWDGREVRIFFFFLLFLLGEYPSFTIISPGRLQFLKRGRHVSRDWNNEMVKIIKNRPTFFREFH